MDIIYFVDKIIENRSCRIALGCGLTVSAIPYLHLSLINAFNTTYLHKIYHSSQQTRQ